MDGCARQRTSYGGPTLVGVDLASDTVVEPILLPPDVALETTYLNDVRFNLQQRAGGVAYLTDSADDVPAVPRKATPSR